MKKNFSKIEIFDTKEMCFFFCNRVNDKNGKFIQIYRVDYQPPHAIRTKYFRRQIREVFYLLSFSPKDSFFKAFDRSDVESIYVFSSD